MDFPWSLVGDVGIGVLVVVLIFTGRLIPKGTVTQWLEVKQQLVDTERRINDVQALSLEQQRATATTLLETNSKLVEKYGETTAYSLREIQRTAKEAAEYE